MVAGVDGSVELIRLRGQVQGVGFRPAVARIAARLQLRGWVRNDADGVAIALAGEKIARDGFVAALLADLPPLARVQQLLRSEQRQLELPATGFRILRSTAATAGAPSACVSPDAAPCAACVAELQQPTARRRAYAFTHCTQCGPRFSICRSLPWDRARTSMAEFELCAACRAEYEDVADRRYHAEPIACPDCGPSLQLVQAGETACEPAWVSAAVAVERLGRLLADGAIVALKGMGGFNLLVDATNEAAVQRLRRRKRRPDKPLALIARDIEVVRSYCEVSAAELGALTSAAAPIVLLRARREPVPLAPSLSQTRSYGCMLPSTPLHHMLLQGFSAPLVCTSGNRSGEPQAIDDADARARLAGIADWILGHDRVIEHRADDSVVRVVAGKSRVLRRARGLAPAALPLPPGFPHGAASVLAAGADLKAAFCLSRAHDLVLSPQLGDLADARSDAEYPVACRRFLSLFGQRPGLIAIDAHPDSRAAVHARELATELRARYREVAHHHAHFAACLGENAIALEHDACAGIVLDGIGAAGDGSSLWGGEILVGGYARVERRAGLQPVALLGGDRAAREPWRCLYAQLRAAMDWGELNACFGELAPVRRLRDKPVAVLERMLLTGIGAPRASSCGRLFDAAAAALELCFEQQTFEAQAALALEDLASTALREALRGEPYPMRVLSPESGPAQLVAGELWRALLGDLAQKVPAALIAARFHVALAHGIARLCAAVVPPSSTVALSGGCMQNALLHERLEAELGARGFRVLTHAEVPANDGGIAYGQALITLARNAEAH